MAAILLVHFANSSAPASAGANTERSSQAESATPPLISEDMARSDCGSETTLATASRTYDSSSEVDEYEASADSDSDEDGCGKALDEYDPSAPHTPGSLARRAQQAHKRRHRTTAEQLRVLEATYATNKVPNQEVRRELAAQLSMTTRRVQIWFQNKRAKEKRMKNLANTRPPGASSAPDATNNPLFNSTANSLQTRSLPEPSAFATSPMSPPARLSALAPPTLTGFFQPRMADPSHFGWVPQPPPLYFTYPLALASQQAQQPMITYAAPGWPL